MPWTATNIIELLAEVEERSFGSIGHSVKETIYQSRGHTAASRENTTKPNVATPRASIHSNLKLSVFQFHLFVMQPPSAVSRGFRPHRPATRNEMASRLKANPTQSRWLNFNVPSSGRRCGQCLCDFFGIVSYLSISTFTCATCKPRADGSHPARTQRVQCRPIGA